MNSELPEGFEPILEVAGHFHIDAESDKSVIEQVSEVIELILLEMKENNAPWDQMSELWMVMIDPPKELHDRWEECPLKDNPALLSFDPFRIIKFGLHPAEMLTNSITMPGESGVFLLLESWAVSSEDLEEGETHEKWHGRIQEHPKAKEWRQLMFASPNGDFAAGGYCRSTGETQIHFFNANELDEEMGFEGSVPEAMLRFVGAIPPEVLKQKTWSSTLVSRIHGA